MMRLFEEMQVDIMMYEEKGFDVGGGGGGGDFNARNGLGVEDHPNGLGKKMLDLVRWSDFVV